MSELPLPRQFDQRIVLAKFDDSGLTAGPRDIRISLPEGYNESAERYPVIYFSDGQMIFSEPVRVKLDADLAHDDLVREGLIHPTILVAIDCIPDQRVRDMTPTTDRGGGGLEGYYSFIANVLKPYIDSHYRTKPEAASTGIAGVSLGGSSSFLMAYMHPETFGMAGCMEPSLWSDNSYALALIDDDQHGKLPIRFWFDAGGGEYCMWLDVARAYNRLEQHGWIPGDDLAAYFDYSGVHDWPDFRTRARPMLYFLLRKGPLRLEGYRLVNSADPISEMMDLSSGRRRLVGAEAHYANGLRLSVPNPKITVENPAVVAVDAGDPILLNVIGEGETAVEATYHGFAASMMVRGYDPETFDRALPCPSIDVHPSGEILRDPAQWPYAIAGTDGSVTARFNVWHDDRHVHVAVHVLGTVSPQAPDKMPWEQESYIGMRFDARPEGTLRKGNGYDSRERYFYIGMNPAATGDEPSVYTALTGYGFTPFMPEGGSAACAVTENGYKGTLSIPSEYLDEQQNGSWRVFRLNICVYSHSTPQEPVQETSWWPDWTAFDSPIGTGIFRKPFK